MDYSGPGGMVFIRQPQLRWTPINENTILAIAIEQPGTSADSGTIAERIDLSNIKGRFQWPDLTGSVKHSWGKSYIRGAGVVRSLKIDNIATNNTQSIVGWGVNASSNVAFYKDVLRLQFVYGEGIENYMNDAPFDVAPQETSNPAMPIKGRPIPMHSFTAYLDHNWSEKWSTSIGLSHRVEGAGYEIEGKQRREASPGSSRCVRSLQRRRLDYSLNLFVRVLL